MAVPRWRVFLTIWAGQLVSLVGSSLTGFALGVWVYQKTGSVTRLAVILLCTILPGVLVSPVAGGLVDRWNRRSSMLVANVGAGLCTLAIVVLLGAGGLELWHIYLLVAAISVFGAVLVPAFLAAIPLLVEQEQLGRATAWGSSPRPPAASSPPCSAACCWSPLASRRSWRSTAPPTGSPSQPSCWSGCRRRRRARPARRAGARSGTRRPTAGATWSPGPVCSPCRSCSACRTSSSASSRCWSPRWCWLSRRRRCSARCGRWVAAAWSWAASS